MVSSPASSYPPGAISVTGDTEWWGSRTPFLNLVFLKSSQPAPTGSPPGRSFPTEEVAFVLEGQIWLQEARPLEGYCSVFPSWQLAMDSWAPHCLVSSPGSSSGWQPKSTIRAAGYATRTSFLPSGTQGCQNFSMQSHAELPRII